MFEKKNQVCNRVWRQTPLIPALGSSDLCELEASLVHTGKLCLKTINKQTNKQRSVYIWLLCSSFFPLLTDLNSNLVGKE